MEFAKSRSAEGKKFNLEIFRGIAVPVSEGVIIVMHIT